MDNLNWGRGLRRINALWLTVVGLLAAVGVGIELYRAFESGMETWYFWAVVFIPCALVPAGLYKLTAWLAIWWKQGFKSEELS